jgi:hypothetical protein
MAHRVLPVLGVAALAGLAAVAAAMPTTASSSALLDATSSGQGVPVGLGPFLFPALSEEDLRLLDTTDTLNATLVVNGTWVQVAVRTRTPATLTQAASGSASPVQLAACQCAPSRFWHLGRGSCAGCGGWGVVPYSMICDVGLRVAQPLAPRSLHWVFKLAVKPNASPSWYLELGLAGACRGP